MTKPDETPTPLALDDVERRQVEQVNARLRHWLDLRLLRWAVGTMLALGVLAVLAALSIGMVRNIERIERDERRADYRLCLRGDLSRAEFHISAIEQGDRELYLARRERLPIMDCSPNFDGQAARKLTRRRQLEFARYYQKHGRAPIVRNGQVKHDHDPNDGNVSAGIPTKGKR